MYERTKTEIHIFVEIVKKHFVDWLIKDGGPQCTLTSNQRSFLEENTAYIFIQQSLFGIRPRIFLKTKATISDIIKVTDYVKKKNPARLQFVIT